MEMIRTRTVLMQHLADIHYAKEGYSIAVESLIFNDDAKLVLLLRGTGSRDEHYKLEGVGGRFDESDEDLHDRLLKKIHQEICSVTDPRVAIEVKIEDLLEVRQVQFQDVRTREWLDWIVVSFLCRLVSGIPVCNEINLHLGIRYLSLDELFAWPEEPVTDPGRRTTKGEELIVRPGLSRSLSMGREVYGKLYGNQPYYETGRFLSKTETAGKAEAEGV